MDVLLVSAAEGRSAHEALGTLDRLALVLATRVDAEVVRPVAVGRPEGALVQVCS